MKGTKLVDGWRETRCRELRQRAWLARRAYATEPMATLCRAYASDLEAAADLIERGAALKESDR
jgi:hypothetical protein